MTQHFAHVDKAYAAVSALDGKWPYVLGGGHEHGFAPSVGISDRGLVGLDCSGFCSLILHNAGLLDSTTPLDTHAFENWGSAGRGKYLTLWVIDSATEDHCFLEFTGRPNVWHHTWAEAGHPGDRGAGWRGVLVPTGFHPRHMGLT